MCSIDVKLSRLLEISYWPCLYVVWHQVTKKIKSVQMFRKPVSSAMQGDRVGVCVTQFDPKLLERGVVCTPGSLRTLYAAVISVRKIDYFKGSLATRAKFHITVGHETVLARVTFFGLPPVGASEPPSDTRPPPSQPCSLETPFTFDREYFYQDEYSTGRGEASSGPDPEQWALLEFERPVTCPSLCLVIGSKLDTDVHANACRLAFHGCLLHGFEDKGYAETALPRLHIYKMKHKEGQVERVSLKKKVFFWLSSSPLTFECCPCSSALSVTLYPFWLWFFFGFFSLLVALEHAFQTEPLLYIRKQSCSYKQVCICSPGE